MRTRNFATLFLALVAAISAIGLAPSANAQTARKKTTKRRPAAVVTATPPIGDAEIISQAGQEPTETVEVVRTPVETPQTSSGMTDAEKIKDLRARMKKLEAEKANEYDEKQKRLLMNLDILTKAEQRSEAIRKQLFEMIEKETNIRTRLDQLDFDMRPEMITRSSSTFAGSMKPEELREMREKTLKAEQKNLQALMTEIQSNRGNLESSLLRSDALVEKLRLKLEKDIDDSLKADDDQ